TEQRHIADRLREDCECRDGMFPRRTTSSRRGFLFAAGSLVGAAGAATIAPAEGPKAPTGAVLYDVPDDPTKVQGRPVVGGSYGTRSQFETEARMPYPTPNENTSWSLTALGRGAGNITPSGLQFERHHGGIPP